MSEGGRTSKPGEPKGPVADTSAETAQVDPRGLRQPDRSWVLNDPLRLVRQERKEAAANIERTLTTWRKAKEERTRGASTPIPANGGRPLPDDVKHRMEGQLDADLSGVRVHTGGESAKAADALGARAFTVGHDIHFGAGEFSPGNREGDRLLAHELTHTVQAANGPAVQRKADEGQEHSAAGEHGESDAEPAMAVSHPSDAAEVEADAAAERVTESLHGSPRPDGDTPKEKAPPLAAKLQGGWRERLSQIMRASKDSAPPPRPPKGERKPAGPAGPPKTTTPAPNPGTPAPAPTTTTAKAGPTSPDPASWEAFTSTLTGEVKAAALSIREPDEQTIFKGLLDPEKLTFAKLTTKEARIEFGGLDNWTRSKVRVVSLQPDQFSVYTSLAGPMRASWRDLTPDERRDLCASSRSEIPHLLGDPASLDKWRKQRNLEVLKANPHLAVQLSVPGGDSPQNIVEGLSVGPAAERLRRILVDTSFAQEDTKFQFIRGVWEDVKKGTEPLKAMNKLQSQYALKGKDAKGHPGFKSIPVMKAIATTAIANYGSLEPDVATKVLETAPRNHPGVPRAPDGKIDDAAVVVKMKDRDWKRQVLAPLYADYSKSKGVRTSDAQYSIRGGATPGAYWLASPDGKTLIDRKLSTAEVMGKLAIDESPEYQRGFIVVELDDGTKAEWMSKIAHITRPTAIDALQFDQFAVNPDPNSCLGITSGGMPEVVVREVPLSRTVIVRQP